MLQGVQLHLESKSPFAWKQLLTLQVRIHHEQRCGIIIQITDDGGDGLFADQITGTFSPMPGDDFLTALWSGTHNGGYEDTVILDALGGAFHMNIIEHMEQIILEKVELCQ